ncbi:MAG: hypothetical protein C0514_02060 [Candidatus Puniceispirillum sp.]|nr:hypothetical protein [Candidatus Puniceispirillum sp.]
MSKKLLSKSLMVLSGALLLGAPVFGSASLQVTDTPGRTISFKSLVENKENRSLLQENVKDQAPSTTKLDIVVTVTQNLNSPVTPEQANQFLVAVDKEVTKTIKAYKDKREAKREIYAAVHAVLDKKYTQMGDEVRDMLDAISVKVKESLAAEGPLKRQREAERDALRSKQKALADERIALFNAMDVIAKAHDSLAG